MFEAAWAFHVYASDKTFMFGPPHAVHDRHPVLGSTQRDTSALEMAARGGALSGQPVLCSWRAAPSTSPLQHQGEASRCERNPAPLSAQHSGVGLGDTELHKPFGSRMRLLEARSLGIVCMQKNRVRVELMDSVCSAWALTVVRSVHTGRANATRKKKKKKLQSVVHVGLVGTLIQGRQT